jgi:hypothetical protein
MALDHEHYWSFEDTWPPNDTEVSCLGTNLHQTAITNLRLGLNEAAHAHRAAGEPLPWTTLSQMALLGCRRPDGSYYRTYPDVFVYPGPVDQDRGSLTVGADGPPVLIVEVLSEATFEADLDLARGKGYSYARAGVLEYIALDPTGKYLPPGVAAWRLADERYRVWEPGPDGRWYSEQLPVAITLEGARAAVYLAGGRRMLAEGEVEEALARQDAELAGKDAEIERLRRLLESR